MITLGENLNRDDWGSFSELLDHVVRFFQENHNTNKIWHWQSFENDALQAIQHVQAHNQGQPYATWKPTLISGSRFPDIVLDLAEYQKFGIEIKTSKAPKGWKALGGSIMESTRVPDVERIRILFAKENPFEVRHKPFEDCISDVVVTHSPRYFIDFDVDPNHTIFKKINTPYDVIWQSKRPFEYFKRHFKEKAKENNSELWFMDDLEERNPSEIPKLQIQFFSDLTKDHRDLLCARAMILFPEIFHKQANYRKVAIWLINMGILNTSLRDMFSSGSNIYVKGYYVSSKFQRLQDHLERIKTIFQTQTYETELYHTYGEGTSEILKYKWKNALLSGLIFENEIKCCNELLSDVC